MAQHTVELAESTAREMPFTVSDLAFRALLYAGRPNVGLRYDHPTPDRHTYRFATNDAKTAAFLTTFVRFGLVGLERLEAMS